MKRNILAFLVLAAAILSTSTPSIAQTDTLGRVLTGADQTEAYLPLLEGKRVGMVVNQTAVILRESDHTYVPLPDSLLRRGANLRCIMAPEHGYKGTAEAGTHIQNGKDEETGLNIYSLYGNDKKPRKEWMEDIDVLVFDIQDVGCRFYTYLSTLYYVIQACAEEGKSLIVLDRPNPNDYVDGPMLRPGFESFVGIVPVPILHGCTLGEMSRMMWEEGWVKTAGQEKELDLTVIRCHRWQHGDIYSLPIPPSKNLRNDHAIALYPSLCLFEGSEVSVGRGTDHPFEVFGKHDLRKVEAPKGLSLQFYLQHQKEKGWGWITRAKFFNLLAGSQELYNQLKAGKTEAQIRKSWQQDLEAYREIRQKYLIY